MSFKSNSKSSKKSKLGYYALSFLRQIIPSGLYKKSLAKILLSINRNDKKYLSTRVNYYNKLINFAPLTEAIALKDLPIVKGRKTYNFDLFEYTRYFDGNLKLKYFPGDVNHIEQLPTIQKSRSLTIYPNDNAVLLNLDKLRHFVFVKDKMAYADKKNILIGRGVVTQPHRIRFMEKWFGNPMCDLGQVNKKGGDLKWLKPKISIAEHLKYKFVLSLEGNDVATNLKWIMSSNSIAVMPKPKYETWFMEGKLVAGKHYIEIKDDYSDLIEKLTWYLEHESAALQIIKNANEHVSQFFDKKREDLIALLVLQKYFYYTGQISNYTLKQPLV